MPVLPSGRFGLATLEADGKLVPAVVTDLGVVSFASLLGAAAPTSVRSAIVGDFDAFCDQVAAALPNVAAGDWTPAEAVVFGPPLPDPSNLYLAGANYHDHIEEMKVQTLPKAVDHPFHFVLPSASLVGTGHNVVRPSGAEQLDWEVELAVVIGRRATDVTVEDALSYVAGYTVANDVSIRGQQTFHPIFGLRFLYAKGQATLSPMGPVIVPARFVDNPGSLALSTHVNGEVRQDSNTAQMVWNVQEQIAYLSTLGSLLPGDIILTGTPAGTAAGHNDQYLRDGDVISARVEGLGELVNTVTAS